MELWFAGVLVVLMLAAAVMTLMLDNLLAAVAASSVVSLAVSVLFVLLRAPDVALTEAVVGAGLSGLVLAVGLRRLGLWRLEGDRGAATPLLPSRERDCG